MKFISYNPKIIGIFLGLFVLICVNGNKGWAQSITISGQVIDKHTQEPLGFANIYIKGTTIGTSTNSDGRYSLQVPAGKGDSITASVVGYQKVKHPISNRSHQEINFELPRSDYTMSKIVVRAGANPAHIILDGIIEHKPENNKENLEAYQYEVYNKLEIDIDNIDRSAIKNRKMFKPFKFVLNHIDTVSEEDPFLPVFLTETFSDYYYQSNPKEKQEYIKASRISGIKESRITDFLGAMYQDINIYQDFIPILGKSFVSPIAEQGRKYYTYKMVDTAIINGRVCYKISFRPKHEGQNTFFGYFWVADHSFALYEISMQMARGVNINFVEKLSVFQQFSPVKNYRLPKEKRKVDSNKVWMLSKDKLVIDFVSSKEALNLPGKKTGESLGLIGRKTTSFRDIKVNPPEIDTVIKQSEDVVVSENVYDKGEDYWNEVRHDTLSKNEKAIYAMVDTLKQIPQFKTYVDVISTIVGGYKEAGKVDIGPYFSFLSTDQVEGVRLRLGVRTNNSFSERLRLKGYVAYGTRDKDYKYGLGGQYVISRNPWQKIGLSYKDDLDLESQHFDELDEDNLFAVALRKNIDQKLLRVKEKRGYYEQQITSYLSGRLTLQNQQIDPYFDFQYAKNETPFTTLTTTEASLNLKYAYNEKFIKGGFNRVSLGTKYPIINAKYTYGVEGVLGSGFRYHRLDVGVEDGLNIKPKGTLEYEVSAGKVFNPLPYLLYKVPKGNETYYYNVYSYNNMNKYQYASDEYAKLFLTHYFEGMLLDRIPLIRKLKWRTLVNARAFWGRLKKDKYIPEDTRIRTAYPIPYVEVGAGIENIFRFFRIDAVWRLTHHDVPNGALNRFNVYGSLQLQF